MIKYLLLFLFLILTLAVYGQQHSLLVVDQISTAPVNDRPVVIENTTNGTITDKDGKALPCNYNINYTEEPNAAERLTSEPEEVKGFRKKENPAWKAFEELIFGYRDENELQLSIIEAHWEDAFLPPVIELLRVTNDRVLLRNVVNLLESKTGRKYGTSYYKWTEYLWDEAPKYDNHYAPLKGMLYQAIDERFEKYFDGDISNSLIRLDEVMWGGVKQDGIPPLRKPKTVGATLANYLADTDVVFGVNVNGIAKAYPKRILGWHEMFIDDFGDTEIAGVYCTLCGTVIAYDTKVNGEHHQLGTSGFLYRSNKLMYDKKTQSLWNTIEGTPVVGPLVGKGIELKTYPVVTTTWGAWKKQHPYTEVLSADTGHNRNYDEGAAYKQYYSSDDLMFPVPMTDKRLYNKDEVFIVRSENYKQDPLAISVGWIDKKGWTTTQIGDQTIVVVTDDAGAISAYEAKDVIFKKYKKGVLEDDKKQKWEITHEWIQSPEGVQLKRLPAHRIFWFAWINTYPDTRLLK